jgi:DNA/RNA endonuclease YhcR with UshA esterase domain
MRLTVTLIIGITLVSSPPVDDKKSGTKNEAEKAVTLKEAAKKVGEKCTVELSVKSTGKGGSGVIFLNSSANYQDDDNFTIFLPKEAVAKFKEEKIEDVPAHFKGKTIRVTGTVKLFRDKPEIEIEKPSQITVVEKM